ncbi:hypothetical protein [Cellulosimicrobium funkei]|uniref:hypothetical protein n=1 Tax=Cellulosimicrobium funkei TaxID=264251 RepID=UPI00343E5693
MDFAISDDLPAFASAEQLEAHTKGKISSGDPRAELLLKGASTAIRRHCGWHVAPVLDADKLVLDGPGGPVLKLPTAYLLDVVELEQDGHPIDPATLEVSRKGLVRLPSGRRWTRRYGGVRITIKHGLTAADDVAAIVLQVCANALSSPMGATREQAGAIAVSWATTAPGVAGGLTLLERDLALLAPLRIGGMS